MHRTAEATIIPEAATIVQHVFLVVLFDRLADKCLIYFSSSSGATRNKLPTSYKKLKEFKWKKQVHVRYFFDPCHVDLGGQVGS